MPTTANNRLIFWAKKPLLSIFETLPTLAKTFSVARFGEGGAFFVLDV
jgi:hypothetical protein